MAQSIGTSGDFASRLVGYAGTMAKTWAPIIAFIGGLATFTYAAFSQDRHNHGTVTKLFWIAGILCLSGFTSFLATFN